MVNLVLLCARLSIVITPGAARNLVLLVRERRLAKQQTPSTAKGRS